jgi:hypothetical protein
MRDLLLNTFGYALTRCTRQQKRDLAAFLGRVAPMKTEHPLVRVGNAHDGGYLLPDDLTGIRTCFSPGVSTVADFELDLTRRGIRCQLADYSVDAAPVASPLIHFEKRFLGTVDDAQYMRLSSWVERHADPGDGDLLLQMDIEGAEYDVLIETPAELLGRFRTIVVEFHGLESLFTPMGFRLVNAVFTKLLRQFTPVHAHPNNHFPCQRFDRFQVPPLMEFTFHRSDRIARAAPAREFPHPLDRSNVPGGRDYPLPECWYAAGR